MLIWQTFMKRTVSCIAVLLVVLAAVPAFAAGVEDDYLRAKSCYGELKVTPAKAKRQGEWQHCIDLFENVFKKYPQSERGPQALYNVGKLYADAWSKLRKKGDAESAVKAFNEFIRTYPKSTMADDALFTIGKLRHDPLHQDDRARTAYAYILENYPDGDMADKAKAELAALDGGASTEPMGVAVSEGEGVAGTAAGAKSASKEAPLDKEFVGVPGAAPSKEAKAPAADVAAERGAEPAKVAASAKGAGKGKGATFEPPLAGPRNPATLNAIDVAQDSAETEVSLVVSQRAAYSVEFTEMGMRTKSPPQLDMLLPYTHPAADLQKEISVGSPHLARIKVKKGLLEGGVRVIFELAPEASYSISSKGGRILLKFRQGGARAYPAPEEKAVKRKADAAPAKGKGKAFVVVVDPGHGGDDPGAIGKNGTEEKDVTLSLSKRLADDLRDSVDAKVYLTRTDDRTLTLEERNAFAVAKKADLFISIHANASTNRKMSGIETYYLNNASDAASAKLAKRENQAARKKMSDVEHILSTMLQNYDAAESQLLASDVQGALVERIGKRYGGVKDRRVRSALFYVLVGAKCPAILVESSFISNPREEKRLREKGYQTDIAASIAAGVRRYVVSSDKRMVAL